MIVGMITNSEEEFYSEHEDDNLFGLEETPACRHLASQTIRRLCGNAGMTGSGNKSVFKSKEENSRGSKR